MSDAGSGEKTEDATDQRREDFRKRGQVAVTRELGSVFTLLGGALVIWALGRFFLTQLVDLLNMSLTEHLLAVVKGGDYKPAMMFVFKKACFFIGPIFAIFGVFAFLSTVVQIGFLVNEEAMQPKIEKLDPIAGFKRILSLRSVTEGIKAVAKVSLICLFLYLILSSELIVIPKLIYSNIPQLMTYIGDISIKLLSAVGAFMVVLAAFDYFFQRWDLEQKMKMTKQEVKEETKSREGDPMIKARVRRTQREMANKRMMAEVPTADVIVTNPTHIAVALKYNMGNMLAPEIVAMGADIVAEKIKEIARENNVPIMENKPLARTMYKTLKVGQAIPKELFTAVAEVLSYVYRLKSKVFK